MHCPQGRQDTSEAQEDEAERLRCMEQDDLYSKIFTAVVMMGGHPLGGLHFVPEKRGRSGVIFPNAVIFDCQNIQNPAQF